MIYFTEIDKDKEGKQAIAETIAFQFYLKELPESIKFGHTTKINHIEYNGGFHTNQIMGVFPKEIEWEGCFYGTYQNDVGENYSAKERSDKVRPFMGRPIRVGFAVPKGYEDNIPGEDYEITNKIGVIDDGKMNGIVGVYVIEEYECTIIDYSNVDYRIKLVPHQRQEKIKPSATATVAVKFNAENITSSAGAIRAAVPHKAKKPLKGAAGASDKATAIAGAASPQSVKANKGGSIAHTTRQNLAAKRLAESKAANPAAPVLKPGKPSHKGYRGNITP